ncbi:hypothetical protein H9P43_000920 [Blastocladiella emersonii ATCC 22665]|nr:hypothetical protein H9P43_000920 [Blastocladiella emersonii ATCC 22665]
MESYQRAGTTKSVISVTPSSASSGNPPPAAAGGNPPPTVRINENGKIRNYVSAAAKHLQSARGAVVIRGEGAAINKAVSVTEIVKRQFPGVVQANELGCTKETTSLVPKDGAQLDRLQTIKHVPFLAMTLSVDSSAQPPPASS